MLVNFYGFHVLHIAEGLQICLTVSVAKLIPSQTVSGGVALIVLFCCDVAKVVAKVNK